MTTVESLVDDLRAESDALDGLVSALDWTAWSTPTPAQGWDIAHQIAHLAWTDEVSTLSVSDPDEFADVVADAATNPTRFVDDAADAGAKVQPMELRERWRGARSRLQDALLQVPMGTKLAWFGPPMSASSMATARIMETWAHGYDIADALGVTPQATDRIKAVAYLGLRTRDFAFTVNGQTPPKSSLRVILDAPSGQQWEYGPPDAADCITGSAVDFCLLVTQRRALADLELTVVGDDAAAFVGIAQAFAGPPGPGRAATKDRQTS